MTETTTIWDGDHADPNGFHSREGEADAATGPSDGQSAGNGLFDLLYVPWVDKAIAIATVLPNSIELYFRYTNDSLTFPRAVLGIQTAILIATMVFRRTPRRVTRNPWFWLLAFVATYGIMTYVAFAPVGTPLVSTFIPNILAVVSGLIMVIARLSLGRSIGFVPADRGIVTTGAYGLVRHPIYTGAFIGLAAFVIRSYSPLNLVLAIALIVLFMIKSVIEEGFLRTDPAYADYMRRVRYRWFPGIA